MSRNKINSNEELWCTITNSRKDLEVHHVESFDNILAKFIIDYNIKINSIVSDYSEEELKLIKSKFEEFHSNAYGVVITKDIHKEFHSTYGYRNNNKAQWNEFISNKIVTF